nr:hypothetical protein [uncultured Massilia sp.]
MSKHTKGPGIAARLAIAFALIVGVTLVLAAFAVLRVSAIERAVTGADRLRATQLEPL